MNSRRLICLPRLGAVYKHSERYHIELWPYLNLIPSLTEVTSALGVRALRTSSRQRQNTNPAILHSPSPALDPPLRTSAASSNAFDISATTRLMHCSNCLSIRSSGLRVAPARPE